MDDEEERILGVRPRAELSCPTESPLVVLAQVNLVHAVPALLLLLLILLLLLLPLLLLNLVELFLCPLDLRGRARRRYRDVVQLLQLREG